MLPSDLTSVRTLSAPSVHPDGTHVLVTMSRPDVDENRYRTSLWRLTLGPDGTAAGPLERFTQGTRDGSAAYSPDGTRVALLTRLGDGMLPHADSVLQEGDLLHVTAQGDRLDEVVAVLSAAPQAGEQ